MFARNFMSKYLTVALLLLTFVAQSSEVSCKQLVQSTFGFSSALWAQFHAKPPKDDLNSSLKNLAVSLLEANSNVYFKARLGLGDIKIKLVELDKMADHPTYPYYRASYVIEFNFQGAKKQEMLDIAFRSNGQAAFISGTWSLAQMNESGILPFKAVVFSDGGNSPIQVYSQDQIVLASLPDTVTLSRSMSAEEKSLWQSGEVEKIKSYLNVMGEATATSPKTTFALNHYVFNRVQPVKIQVPKSLLLELYQKQSLTVNTYEDSVNSGKGMPSEAQTSFGLEVEIVIHGNEGRKFLQPFLRSAFQ